MPKETADLFFMPQKPEPGRRIYSVSEITQDIKLILESNFGEVWLEGEVSNFKAYPSGHFYFTLKDTQAVLAAVIFSRTNRDLRFKIEDGLKVICFGKINVYPPRGQYQFIVERIEPKGIGAQQLAFEQLKEKLFKEGLFEAAHKRPLPLMPFRIGIVTSTAGAALRDILQILKNGSPSSDVVIRPVRVQGESAAAEIAAAVADLNQYQQIDAIIISRGGGSSEDLWSFNEEIVARAIYGSLIPTISAVGHQINVTLADLVADVFVETPSAAAKIIAEKRNAILADLNSYRYELYNSVIETVHGLRNQSTALRHALKSPLDRLLEKQQLLDELQVALTQQLRHYLQLVGERASSLIQRLQALSPLAVLARGYSLTMLWPGAEIVKEATQLEPGAKVKTVLAKGSFISSVQEVS